MITIGDKSFKSNIPLESILAVKTKVNMCLVLTYEDEEKNEWHMLMPDCVRESLAPYCQTYLDLAKLGKKGPTPKELRMMVMLQMLYGEK